MPYPIAVEIGTDTVAYGVVVPDLPGCFCAGDAMNEALASLRHHLIVWADKQQIVHHRRADDGAIETEVVTDGTPRLEPPGVTIVLADIYAE